MNLTICTAYDPRASLVRDSVSRWPVALNPLVYGDDLGVIVEVVDGGGARLAGSAPTYALEVALVRATGQTLAEVTPGAVSSPTAGVFAFTLPVYDGGPVVTDVREYELGVILNGPAGLHQTIARLPVLLLPEHAAHGHP